MITREQFYKTKEWKKLRKLIIISQGGICARCSNPAVYVHHKEYLTDENYLDPMIALNPDNLEGLCMDCHNEEHNPTLSIRSDVKFDDDGNLIERV